MTKRRSITSSARRKSESLRTSANYLGTRQLDYLRTIYFTILTVSLPKFELPV